jgi:hypothetical protein
MIAQLAEAARDENERQRRIETKLDRILDELAQVRASLPPRMISLADAARALACDVQTVRAMCDRSELVWRRCGRRIVVDAASLRPTDRAEISALARSART